MKRSLEQLQAQVLAFRDARDWQQFHNPKDLALVLAVEVGEVLDLFRFQSPAEIEGKLKRGELPELATELADVFNLLLLLAEASGVDLARALDEKLTELDSRYPVERVKGRKEKYTEYRD
ncbi:MAG: nucleotide pyrophosphohydrolase [Vulcanimicrobiota bacterium]